MEEVLDFMSVKKGCLIRINERGMYDLTVFDPEKKPETITSISLKMASRIAVEKLTGENEWQKK